MREKEDDEADAKEAEAEEEEASEKNIGDGGGGVTNPSRSRGRSLTPPPTAADVESVVKPLMAAALARFAADFPGHAGEVKLCVHVAWGANPTDRALPPMPPAVLASYDLAASVGRCKLNFVDPQLESDWFQTLTLEYQS
jgi:hypothetical protein